MNARHRSWGVPSGLCWGTGLRFNHLNKLVCRVFKHAEGWEEQGNKEKRSSDRLGATGQTLDGAQVPQRTKQETPPTEQKQSRHTTQTGWSPGSLPNLLGPGTRFCQQLSATINAFKVIPDLNIKKGFIWFIVLWRNREVWPILARLAKLLFSVAMTGKIVLFNGCTHTRDHAKPLSYCTSPTGFTWLGCSWRSVLLFWASPAHPARAGQGDGGLTPLSTSLPWTEVCGLLRFFFPSVLDHAG